MRLRPNGVRHRGRAVSSMRLRIEGHPGGAWSGRSRRVCVGTGPGWWRLVGSARSARAPRGSGGSAMPGGRPPGACAASRSRKPAQSWVAAGDQPSSAMAGSRGKVMNSMSAIEVTVSVHSGASTPSTAAAGTPSSCRARVPVVRPAHLDQPGPVLARAGCPRCTSCPGSCGCRARGSAGRPGVRRRGHGGVVRPRCPSTARTRPSTCSAGAIWCQPSTGLAGRRDDRLRPVHEGGVVGRRQRERLVAADVQVRPGVSAATSPSTSARKS